MPSPYIGKCLCGSIRLKITSEPLAVLSCFCEHCKLGAGAPNQVIAKFKTQDVEISNANDSLGLYELTETTSGNPKEKAFCKTCAVPLWTVPGQARGKFMIVRTAVLEHGFELKPGSEIFVKNRPAWMSPVEGTSQFDGPRT